MCSLKCVCMCVNVDVVRPSHLQAAKRKSTSTAIDHTLGIEVPSASRNGMARLASPLPPIPELTSFSTGAPVSPSMCNSVVALIPSQSYRRTLPLWCWWAPQSLQHHVLNSEICCCVVWNTAYIWVTLCQSSNEALSGPPHPPRGPKPGHHKKCCWWIRFRVMVMVRP